MASATSGVQLLAGPQLLGFFFDWALQGVLSVQIYIYHLCFPNDSITTKALVYGIFIYEWIQTALITQAAFQVDVFNYGNRTALTAFHNTWFSVTLMCAVVSAIVQGYFCWRISVLSRSKLLPCVISLFAFCQMSVGVAGGIMLRVIDPTAAEASTVTPVISAWLAGAAFVDVMIAACMSYLLLRSKSGIKRSDALVNRLARLVIESGTLTAAVAVVDVICFTVVPQTLLHECPALVLAKLYSNTLLVSLNNRVVMRRLDSVSSFDTTRSGFQSLTVIQQATPQTASKTGGVRVDVSQEHYVAHDVHDIVLEDAPGIGKARDAGLELTRLDSTRTDKDKAAV